MSRLLLNREMEKEAQRRDPRLHLLQQALETMDSGTCGFCATCESEIE